MSVFMCVHVSRSVSFAIVYNHDMALLIIHIVIDKVFLMTEVVQLHTFSTYLGCLSQCVVHVPILF